LQVGVNYANDYSDGIRGTDADRVGPLRLTASPFGEASWAQLISTLPPKTRSIPVPTSLEA
jgi:1,4-dihydroxy-2-naphthoate octaprenyltransferase